MTTTIIGSIRDEFLRHRALAEGAITQLSDDELWVEDAPGSNSIATICRHVSGNLRSRFTDFLTTDGEKPWRNRDSEFEPSRVDRQALLDMWAGGWQVLLSALDGLTDANLSDVVEIRQQPLTVAEALHRALAHLSYHAGQIVFVAKMRRGGEWTTLSIPPARPPVPAQPAEGPSAPGRRQAFKPAGHSSVSPYLIVEGAEKTIAFLKAAFDADELRRFAAPDGRLMHAEVRIDDTVVMLADAVPDWPSAPAHVHIYVKDVDAAYTRALAAGGVGVQEPVRKGDEDKRGGVKDSGGTTWWIATRMA